MNYRDRQKTFPYKGPLSQQIKCYIAQKRGEGLLFNKESQMFASLDRLSLEFEIAEGVLTKRFVETWCGGRSRTPGSLAEAQVGQKKTETDQRKAVPQGAVFFHMPESQTVPAILFSLERKFFVKPVLRLGKDEISTDGYSHHKVNEISSAVMEYMWAMTTSEAGYGAGFCRETSAAGGTGSGKGLGRSV